MKFEFPESERFIIDVIAKAGRHIGFPTYVVGGFVRDRMLGRECKDIDVVCVGNGLELAKTVSESLNPQPKVNYFKRFGTAMLKYEGLEVEFVGARKESYSEHSRKPAVENGTLEDDQNRRDFTINAMAVDLSAKAFGEIIDPFDGLLHLEEGIIKTPLAPSKTLSDDPLRMMRAIRFATQLNFQIEDETLEAIKDNNKRLDIISAERINSELAKIIMSAFPSVGFILLNDTGLLDHILPELVALEGVEYLDGKGHKDNFYHTLEVLDNTTLMTNDYWLRWAALLHDIGKPRSKRFDKNSGWTFHGHEMIGSNMVAKIFQRLKLPLDHNMRYVEKLVAMHQRPISLTKEEVTDSAIRRLIFEAGEELDDLITLCNADITSKNLEKVKKYRKNYDFVKQRITEVEQKDHIRNWQPPITGQLIMATFDIPPSRMVGDIKMTIREAIMDGEIPNDYTAAYVFMLEKGRELGLVKKSLGHRIVSKNDPK